MQMAFGYTTNTYLLTCTECNVFCVSYIPCERALNVMLCDDTKIDCLIALVERLLDKLAGLETKLDEKCDVQDMNLSLIHI